MERFICYLTTFRNGYQYNGGELEVEAPDAEHATSIAAGWLTEHTDYRMTGPPVLVGRGEVIDVRLKEYK